MFVHKECREEHDEETMEWEQEQLRRGGHNVEIVSEKPQKATYKAAPSTSSLMFVDTLLICHQSPNFDPNPYSFCRNIEIIAIVDYVDNLALSKYVLSDHLGRRRGPIGEA